MEFYEFRSTYDFVRKTKMAPDDTPESFYRGMLDLTYRGAMTTEIEGYRAENNRQAAEMWWYRNGCPYYKVFPGVIGLLANVGIEIPCEYLTLPFSSFLVRLPKHDNPFQLANGKYIQSFLVAEGVPDDDAGRGRQVFLWIDCGEADAIGAPVLCYHQFPGRPGITIDEAAYSLPLNFKMPTDLNREQTDQLLRLAVSICFLATGSDKLISTDVLSKDLSAWLEAIHRRDDERRKVIESRAERRGKKGWNVGIGERHFIRPRDKKSDGEGSGRELSYKHQRSCHFRRLPSSKIIFIRQMTIRADLPAKPVDV